MINGHANRRHGGGWLPAIGVLSRAYRSYRKEQFSFRRNPFLGRGRMNQLKAGVVRSFAPDLLPEARSDWPRYGYKPFLGLFLYRWILRAVEDPLRGQEGV